jgi:hypothetical protein
MSWDAQNGTAATSPQDSCTVVTAWPLVGTFDESASLWQNAHLFMPITVICNKLLFTCFYINPFIQKAIIRGLLFCCTCRAALLLLETQSHGAGALQAGRHSCLLIAIAG